MTRHSIDFVGILNHFISQMAWPLKMHGQKVAKPGIMSHAYDYNKTPIPQIVFIIYMSTVIITVDVVVYHQRKTIHTQTHVYVVKTTNMLPL
jgi:hypothetical protein